MQKMFAPIVNLNGTSRGELREQLLKASTALNMAISALEAAAPHGRDYQNHPAGEKAYWTARRNAASRIRALAQMREEIYDTYRAMEDGRAEFDRPALCPACGTSVPEPDCICDR